MHKLKEEKTLRCTFINDFVKQNKALYKFPYYAKRFLWKKIKLFKTIVEASYGRYTGGCSHIKTRRVAFGSCNWQSCALKNSRLYFAVRITWMKDCESHESSNSNEPRSQNCVILWQKKSSFLWHDMWSSSSFD